MSIFIKIIKFFKSLVEAYRIPVSIIQIVLKNRCNEISSSPKVLAQLAEDYTYFFRLFHLCRFWGAPSIDWIVVRGDRYEPKGLLRRIIRGLQANRITDLKWTLLYKGTLGGKIEFGNFQKSTNPQSVKELAMMWSKEVKSVEDLLALKSHGIILGDLIYDSYLRFKPAPTIDINDPYLHHLYSYAAKILLGLEFVLKKAKYDFFVSTFSSYIDHGVAVRLCLKFNVKVICTGVFNQVLVQPTLEFPYHKRNFHLYKSWVCDDNKENLRFLGHRILKERFSGKIDTMTTYMKASSFKKADDAIFDLNEKKCLIMAHDFFDSPHVYGDMLFPDYFIWLDFLLREASKSTTYSFYLKTHPNAVGESKPYYDLLISRYPRIKIIEPGISNLSIMRSNFRLVFTLSGTVGHEFPYAGIPTVSAGINPHSAFSFTYEARTIEELASIVHDPDCVSQNIDTSEIELFVGVHSWRIYKHDLKRTFPWLSTVEDLKRELNLHDNFFKERLQIIQSELATLQDL